MKRESVGRGFQRPGHGGDRQPVNLQPVGLRVRQVLCQPVRLQVPCECVQP